MSFLDYIKVRDGVGASKFDSYFPLYEQHFSRWFGLSPTVLELGAGGGNSLVLWRVLFGINANIYGIDINPDPVPPFLLNKSIFVGNQGDSAFLDSVLEKIGPPDIVIDDGSHVSSDMMSSFKHLYPKLPKDGVYLIEDTHAPPAWEFSKSIAEMSFRVTANNTDDNDWFRRNTRGIHFYESVIVVERGVSSAEKCMMAKTTYMEKFNKDLIEKLP